MDIVYQIPRTKPTELWTKSQRKKEILLPGQKGVPKKEGEEEIVLFGQKTQAEQSAEFWKNENFQNLEIFIFVNLTIFGW